jgi:hypothetical protein
MHRSTATGTKDAGRAPDAALDGQPEQATWPAATGPPLTVGTGVAGPAAGADPLTPPGEPLPAEPLPAAPVVGAAPPGPVPEAVAPELAPFDAVLFDGVPLGAEPPAAPTDALPHPAASAPAASSVTATAAVRRPAREIGPFGVIM